MEIDREWWIRDDLTNLFLISNFFYSSLILFRFSSHIWLVSLQVSIKKKKKKSVINGWGLMSVYVKFHKQFFCDVIDFFLFHSKTAVVCNTCDREKSASSSMWNLFSLFVIKNINLQKLLSFFSLIIKWHH